MTAAAVSNAGDGLALAAQIADLLVAVDAAGTVLRVVSADAALPMAVERAIVRRGLSPLLGEAGCGRLATAVGEARPVRLEVDLPVGEMRCGAVLSGRPVGAEYLVAVALRDRRSRPAPGETAMLLDRLDRSRDWERRLGAETRALLDGLAALTSDAPAGERNRALFAAFSGVLPYDLAVLIAPGEGGGPARIERASRAGLDGAAAILDLDPGAVGGAEPVRRVGVGSVLSVGDEHYRSILALRVAAGDRDRLLALLRADRAFEDREVLLLRRLSALVAQQFERETRRQTAVELRRASDLGEMLAGVAHEVKQPLATIALAVQNALLLMARGAPPDEIARRLERIETYCAKAAEIADAMRELAHPDLSRDTVADVADAVRSARLLVGPTLDRARIALDYEAPASLPPVRCHPVGLRQVIVNLVTNARDAIVDRRAGEPDRPGRIAVTARREQDHVVLEVADDGRGLPADLLPRLFRERVTTKRADQGTGLGLGIVGRIVRDAGGSADARNGTDGAVFTIRLPAAEDPP